MKILLIEDGISGKSIEIIFGHLYDIKRVYLLNDGLKELESSSYDVVLLDMYLPDSFCPEKNLEQVLSKIDKSKIICLSGDSQLENLVNSKNVEWLGKPFSFNELKIKIEKRR